MTDALPPTRSWQRATVIGLRDETARVRTIRLALAAPGRHRAGQHYVVRLTAPDGYTAARSYSVSSAPDDSNELELTVERIHDGEVSTFLHDILEVGDTIEVRGPIGGWFVWSGEAPAHLVGGGSGLVPLMSMLRLARARRRPELVRVVVSVRSPDDLLFAAELPGPEVTIAFTRDAPAGHPRPPGRLTAADLAPVGADDSTVYVCGSAGFADHVTALLVEMGVSTERIRVERFGPSG